MSLFTRGRELFTSACKQGLGQGSAKGSVKASSSRERRTVSLRATQSAAPPLSMESLENRELLTVVTLTPSKDTTLFQDQSWVS